MEGEGNNERKWDIRITEGNRNGGYDLQDSG